MWRAKLGEKNHLNSVQYGVNPIEPSPPGWTLTPLFQEVQFVKETCARIALENAALVAQNGKLKAEMAELREDVATTNGRIDEVEVLRERDVHHLKQEIAKLHSQRNADREHFKAALEAERDEVAKQFAAAAKARDELRAAAKAETAALGTRVTDEQAELRAASEAKAHAACDEVEVRAAAAREPLIAETAALKVATEERADRDAATAEAAVAAAKAETVTLQSATEERAKALEAAIADSVAVLERAIDTKLTNVHQTLLKLDRQARSHSSAIEESKEEATEKHRAAGDERVELEGRITELELKLQLLEREVSRSRED